MDAAIKLSNVDELHVTTQFYVERDHVVARVYVLSLEVSDACDFETGL